jgi:tRNA (cmo5U34)-methyltransferase
MRAVVVRSRLQDDWTDILHVYPNAIISTSAIHHLEPAEKQSLYRQCFEFLAPGGVFLNGDEVRAADDAAYLAELESWADHMRRGMADGSIGESFHPALHKWIERNLTHFGEPKRSGDDCHETIAVQLDYLRGAGFSVVDCPWQKALWAVLRAVKV